MAGLLDTQEEGRRYVDDSPGLPGTSEEREKAKRESEARPLLRKARSARRLRGRPLLGEEPSYSRPEETTGSFTYLDNEYKTSRYTQEPVPTNEFLYRDPAVDEVTGILKKEDSWGIKALDFLFGPEMATVGIAHDADGWSWNMENMKQQWSEQPLWSNLFNTASIIGTILWPATAAVKGSLKGGLLAGKAGRAAFEAAELGRWKELGLIDPEIISKVSHEALDSKTIKRLRIIEASKTKQIKRLARRDKARAIAAGEEGVKWDNPIERAKYEFERRFANTYGDVINSDGMVVDSAKARFAKTLDAALGEGTVGKLLETMPSDDSQFVPISAYLMSRLSPEVAAKAGAEIRKLTPASKAWADFFVEASIKKQKRRLDLGMIDQQTYDTIGRFHIAGVDKGTAGFEGARSVLIPVRGPVKKVSTSLIEKEVPRKGLGKLFGKSKTLIEATDEAAYVPISLSARPMLSGPSMMHRASTYEEMYDKLISGRLISDPADVLAKGYLTDELLTANYEVMRDIAIDPKMAISAKDAELYGFKKAKKLGFVNLEGEGILGHNGAAALRRMIAKETGQPETALPWIRKEIFDDIFGVSGMMEQTSHATANMMDVATTLYKTGHTVGNIPTHLQNITGNLTFLAQAGFNPVDPENIALMSGLHKSFTKLADISAVARQTEKGARGNLFDEAGALKKIKFGNIKYKGKTLNLDKELTDPIIKELIEDSAFSSAEGAGNLVNVAQSLREGQTATKAVIGLVDKGRKIAQIGDRVKWWEGMTRAYLEQDMLPKMAYYLSLRADGLSKLAAATEVARRLPMYNTVGSTVKFGRKFWVPWATFPAEAARITKNNIQDYPLRMMPWLRAPQIMQTIASGMGIAPNNAAEVEATTKQLPWWAQKNTTVIAKGSAIAKTGGAAGGALAGAFIGGQRGPTGAVVGAALGATAGGIAMALATDEQDEKELRGALMDWIPHSTLGLASTSRDWAGEGALPWQTFQGSLEQLPAEPLAILKPIIDVVSGKDAFGNPVGDGTFFGGVAKSIAGAIGLAAPPIIQKYGFKMSTPDVPASIDPFGITNISRLKVEGGKLLPFVDPAVDPMTGLVGSLSNDFFLNNFGAFKAYRANAEQQLANETITERNMGEVRNYLTKNLAFHLENGNDEEVVGLLNEVMSTFAKQYANDPRTAQAKYTKWLENHVTQIGRHPRLRGWSEEEIVKRMNQAGYAAGEARSAARNQVFEALRQELLIRNTQEEKGALLNNVEAFSLAKGLFGGKEKTL